PAGAVISSCTTSARSRPPRWKRACAASAAGARSSPRGGIAGIAKKADGRASARRNLYYRRHRPVVVGGARMQRLSSTSTGFYKRVFPGLWFGFIALFFGFALWDRWHGGVSRGTPSDVMLLVTPLLMAAFGVVLFRRLLFDRGQQRRVALTDVVNVNTGNTNPRRITVMLRTGSPSSFSFMPASPRGFLSAFRPDPIAIELIRRVDARRQVAR